MGNSPNRIAPILARAGSDDNRLREWLDDVANGERLGRACAYAGATRAHGVVSACVFTRFRSFAPLSPCFQLASSLDRARARSTVSGRERLPKSGRRAVASWGSLHNRR